MQFIVNFSLTTLGLNPKKSSTKVVSCVVLCMVCVYMCTVLLTPGVNPIAVNKYININKELSDIFKFILLIHQF